ncbi:MAG: alpha/beta hydrolase [Burkholderiaceae bacterium]|nr:alpha/beta hydrolase [Burkholderiaceae bacterium]
MYEPRFDFVQCISSAGTHRMAYVQWGDPANDQVIVCVHGLTRCARDFDRLAQALAPKFRVVCPDVVGRGQSDWLKNPMLYGFTQYISDMFTLLARINSRRLMWLGTSMGGLIGLGVAAQENSPITRLILNDVGPKIEVASLLRIGSYLGKATLFESFEAAVDYIQAISASFGQHTSEEWRELTRYVVRQTPNGWVLHYDPAIALPFGAVTPAQASATEALFWQGWAAIKAKTLIIRGQNSDLLAPSTLAQMLALNPHASSIQIPNVGHAPTFMHEDQIQIVTDFFQGE